MSFWKPKKPSKAAPLPEFSPEDQAIIDSFVTVYPTDGTQIFSDEQIQLQSLIISGLIPENDIEHVKSLAYSPAPSFKETIWIKNKLSEILNDKTQYNFENLFTILDMVPKKLYYKFRNFPLKLSVATDSSKDPGAISIVSEEPQGPGYIGRIDKDQSVYITKDAAALQEEVIKVLVDLNTDTMTKLYKVAIEDGRCCFCRKALLSMEDDKVGYDSTCARVYGMPHGELIAADPNIAKVSPRQILNAIVEAAPEETLAQKIARGPFDPAVMNAILGENPGKRW